MDRTATSDWRSSDVSPVALKRRHRQDIADTMGQPATTSLDSSHFTSEPITFDRLTKPIQDFSTNVQKWATTAPGVSNVLGAADNVLGKIQEPGQWLSDRLGLHSQQQNAYDLAKQRAQVLRGRGAEPTPAELKSQEVFGQALLNYQSAAPFAGKSSVTARPHVEPVRPTVPAPRAIAPREQLALPARIDNVSDGLPAGGVPNRAASRPSIVDTTARPVTPEPAATSPFRNTTVPADTAQWIKERIAATKPDVAPVSLEDLRARIGVKPEPTTLRSRVGTLTPIGREDLAGKFAKPADVPPLSIDDLRSRIGATDAKWQENVSLNASQLSERIGAKPRVNVPQTAEQIAAQAGEKTRAQTENALRTGQEVEARQAATGTLGQSGMSGPLVGRAIGRGNSQLARAGRKSEGLTASPEDLNASLVRQQKVHNANEDAIVAAKAGDRAAYDRAVENVKLLGGDVKHTETRVRQAGTSAPQRVTTDATVMSDMQASIDALKTKAPPGKSLLADTTKAAPESAASSLGPTIAERMRVFLKGEGGAAPTGGALGGGFLRPDVSRIAEQVAGTGKTLTTAMSPFHFMFRHALPFMTSHPQAWLKGSAKGLAEGFRMNPKELAARTQTMHDNLVRNGVGHVYLGRPHLGAIGGEEAVASGWMNKLGPLGTVIERAGQGFTMGLNEVRYEAVKGAINSSEWMVKHGLAQKMTWADRRALGDAVNHFSGRGIDSANLGETGRAAMRLANIPMFSPQLASARVRMLGDFANGIAEVAGNLAHGKAPRADAIERARLGIGYITGVGSLYLLMQAAGGKLDANPLSSTAGQVAFGEPDEHGPLQSAVGVLAPEFGMGDNQYEGAPLRVDPTASEATLIRNIARFATAIYDRATGEQNLKKGTGNQQEQTPVDVAMNAFISTLFTSPIGYPVAEWLRGYPVEPLDSVLPMPVSGWLRGNGVKMPQIGAKEKTTTGTPRSGPAPTRAPAKR